MASWLQKAAATGPAGSPLAPTVVEAYEVAHAVLRLGLVLMFAAAATDWVFAAIAGAGLWTTCEGLGLTALAGMGMLRARVVARLLRPVGRVLIPAAVFAGVGALDFGLQTHYSEVAPAIVWIAAIVSSRNWVVCCVAVSAAGYVGDLWLQGHSLAWMLTGGGLTLVANQIVDLVANAGVVLLIMSLLRRFVAGVPESLDAVRSGGPSLTAQLALAASGRPQGLLPRADAATLTVMLTATERSVLSLLAEGRAPKQAARDLGVAVVTVRSHIASAKRKTGARTIEQLVALHTEALLGS